MTNLFFLHNTYVNVLGAQYQISGESCAWETAITIMCTKWECNTVIYGRHKRKVSEDIHSRVSRRDEGNIHICLSQHSQLRTYVSCHDFQRVYLRLCRIGSFRRILYVRTLEHEDKHGKPSSNPDKNYLFNTLCWLG